MRVGELIDSFLEMEELMELAGANPFKSGAFGKAARALEENREKIDLLARENRLMEISGIGKSSADKIIEFREKGEISELVELRKKIPAGLREMTKIPGFGAKKTLVAFSELGVDTIEKLEEACRNGTLATLKGFGAKSSEKILAGIEQVRQFSGRHRLDVALYFADTILSELLSRSDVIRAETAGSLRRMRETVKDLDFVAATENPRAVLDWFATQPGVVSVIGNGETKASVLLTNGIQADLRCVSDVEFPYTLLHFTGSKEHNTRLRSRAKEFGLKLNEYGLFPEGEDNSFTALTEAEIYRHLKLEYIAPEMREDMGEVEAAEHRKLPQLIERRDIRGLMHMHTTYSDGRPMLGEYAAWALAHQIEWMGIADHSKSLIIANGMSVERVAQQHREIDEVNAEYSGRVRLLKGVESDILADGRLDYDDETLACFDFIVASVHTLFNLTEAEQTKRICTAIANPHTTILGHMTGRLLLARDGYPCDQHCIIREAARAGVAVEINANPWRLDMDWRLIHFAIDQGCKLTIGPDAHIITGLDDTRFGIAMARKGWARKSDILNCLGVDDFLKFARKENRNG